MVSFMLQNTNDEVSVLPLKRKKQNLQERSTLSSRDHNRKAVSDIYTFLKAVSLRTPKLKAKGTSSLQITKNIPKKKQEGKRISSEILALSKKIDLLASKREQKQAFLQSKKDNDFTSQRPDEKKTKSLIDIAKAIELITSQGAKHALSQLSALSEESKFSSLEYGKTPIKLSELNVSSEVLSNSNLTEREKRLQLELQKIRKEIDLLTPERDKKLSTQDEFSFTIKPTKFVSVSSNVYSDPTTEITTTTTKQDTQLNFHDIMNRRKTEISILTSENKSAPGLHKEKSIKDHEGKEISLTARREAKNDQDLYNFDRNITLSDNKTPNSGATETKIDVDVLEKRPDSVLEQLNKLINLTLIQHLKTTKQELPNIATVPPTTASNFDLHRLTKRTSKRPKALRRTNKIQQKHKRRNRRKHSTRKIPIINESEIDKFRRQLRMEYDSHEHVIN